MKNAWISLATVCALVIGVYAYTAHEGAYTQPILDAASSYYNLLVQGFRAGQLSLKMEVPPRLAQLADFYDPKVNSDYQFQQLADHHPLYDLSYYKGKLYLYFGVTPALLLFWPYAALTGHHLLHKDAVVIFCAVGFLAGVGLLYALWRRYFAAVGFGVVVAGTVALGLVPFTLVILPQSDVYEVSISCGYALTMLALAAIWRALHEPSRRGWWLAAASLAYGLALGARPSLLLGAVILLVPVAQAWRERRRMGVALLAATGPIVLIGLGLMLYNFLRFDNPLEFGQRYQLAANRQDTMQHFSLSYFWFNFRVFFLAPAHWGGGFPFVRDIAVPALPKGYIQTEHPFGVLTNIPVVWLALAAPVAWRNGVAEARSALRWFLAAVALLFGLCALTLCLYNYACIRYELEFVQPLMLLAVIGIFGLERAAAGRPVWGRAARWGWGLALAFSVAFNLLAGVDRQADADGLLGKVLFHMGETDEAIAEFHKALRLRPEEALTHNNLGIALLYKGRLDEATAHFRKALEIQPELAKAHNDLGYLLGSQGQWAEAIEHFRKALELQPDFAEAHNNLGNALCQEGREEEAIAHYKKTLEIQPGQVDVQNDLAWVLATCPEALLRNGNKAIELAQQANQFTGGGNPGILDTLAAAYAEGRQFSNAVVTAQRALSLALARNNTNLADALREEIKLYQANKPFHRTVNGPKQTD